MLKFGKAVAKLRIPIIILAVLLLIPSFFGMLHTRTNYDMLTYLPKNLETVKGQDILLNKFGKGAFSYVIVEGMDSKDVVALKDRIEKVDHVASALWYDSLADISVPMEVLPDKVYKAFNSGDATLIAVFFDSSSSSDETIDAIQQIRQITGKQCYVSGISALVADLKQLCEKEEPIYVTIAVLCSLAAMLLLTDSWLVPFVFLIGIGFAIMYNMGTNFFLGEISYITKALAAVLQLAVTMDYSIFLWHAYCEQKLEHPDDKNEAMAHAIKGTIVSVSGSSLTTIAGFIALCFMSYTMGADLGIVMAKGVLLGVISSITILPSLILVLDKPLAKTRHRSIIPDMRKPAGFIVNHFWIFIILFAVIIVPAAFGYAHTPVYYDFTNVLTSNDISNISTDDMQFLVANTKLNEKFDISSTHMILCKSDMPAKDAKAMLNEIDGLDGIRYSLGLNSVVGSLVPEEAVPQDIMKVLKSGDYQLILINSSYKVSTDECNNQINEINTILKKYDPDGMLIGEGPCTKDLIQVTNHDFTVVTWISIGLVFLIIALTLKSVTLPVILVAIIEFAVCINLGIPYYTNLQMPFIAPICISTIQLGATVDYAILMTTRYQHERSLGNTKRDSIVTALATSIPSIIVSGLGFFAATFGVAVYSDISLISSMCRLMARGAIISVLAVIFVLPAMFMLFDKVICKTSKGFIVKKEVA